MPTINLTAPTRRAFLPICFALYYAGRWVGVCRQGSAEYRTAPHFCTRDAALADAKRIAATLAHDCESQL
jgi:hypothetical protein